MSVLPVTLRNAIYSGVRGNATTVAHIHDNEVETVSDAEKRRRLTRV